MNEVSLLAAMGTRIKEFRKQKQLTQQAVAEECNMEKAMLSKIEAGKINVTIRTLLKISTVLDAPIERFFAQ